MNTRTVIAGAAIAVIAVFVAVVLTLRDTPPAPAPAPVVLAAPPRAEAKRPPPESPAVHATATPAPAPTTVADTLQTSRDYFEYAQSLIAAARGGDHAAQYNLSQALKYCDEGYRSYFDRGNRRLTLDEALVRISSSPPAVADEVRNVYSRCQRLKDNTLASPPFGEASDWLLAASNGDYPLAQVALARDLYFESAGGGGFDAGKREEAKRLAEEALRSRDPAVLWESGDLTSLYTDDQNQAAKQQWVRRIAACQRGYDCSGSGEWHAFVCRIDPSCQPYETFGDYMRRIHGNEMDDIERQARELNAKLDAQ